MITELTSVRLNTIIHTFCRCSMLPHQTLLFSTSSNMMYKVEREHGDRGLIFLLICDWSDRSDRSGFLCPIFFVQFPLFLNQQSFHCRAQPGHRRQRINIFLNLRSVQSVLSPQFPFSNFLCPALSIYQKLKFTAIVLQKYSVIFCKILS